MANNIVSGQDNTENKLERINDSEYINLFVQHGLIGDTKIKDKEQRIKAQKKNQSLFHNTLTLLKNYRKISWTVSCFPERIGDELGKQFKSTDEILDYLDVEMGRENRMLENWAATTNRTRVLLDRVNEAISLLKKYPDRGELLYEIIYVTFVSEEKLTHAEILDRLCMTSRDYYRKRDEAISIISIRLWSYPDKYLEIMSDILDLMDREK